jgi:hypothetical protein
MPDPNSNSFFARLGGKLFKIRFVLSREIPSDRWADCSHPQDKNKEIRVRRVIAGKERLETILHEARHAIYPDEGESSVDCHGKDLANLLWRCGYRHTDNKRK